MKNQLKFLNYAIAFQEVPNEISLVFNISGCPHRCEGCHTPELWEGCGEVLLDNFYAPINFYSKYITCVCLMGGEQNKKELKEALEIIKSQGLKTCVYSGCDSLDPFKNILYLLDYLKIGHYDYTKGGLSNINTNQQFFKIENGELKDITTTFIK